MSRLENYLNRLCKYARNARKVEIAVSDLNGAGIKRAVTYLRKVINVEMPQSREWEEISVAQVIRNLVVHNDGNLNDESSSRIRAYVKNSSRISVSDREEIVLTEEFLPALLDDIGVFADQLLHAMEMALANDV